MLAFLNLFFYIFMMLMGLNTFIAKREHLLMTLISLEFIVLILYLFMFYYLSMMQYEYYFSVVFLTFSVCEGSLGLSILVTLIRTHGTDYFQSCNLLQC